MSTPLLSLGPRQTDQENKVFPPLPPGDVTSPTPAETSMDS